MRRLYELDLKIGTRAEPCPDAFADPANQRLLADCSRAGGKWPSRDIDIDGPFPELLQDRQALRRAQGFKRRQNTGHATANLFCNRDFAPGQGARTDLQYQGCADELSESAAHHQHDKETSKEAVGQKPDGHIRYSTSTVVPTT